MLGTKELRLAQHFIFNVRAIRSLLEDHNACGVPSGARDEFERRVVRLYLAARDVGNGHAQTSQLATHVGKVREALVPMQKRSDSVDLTAKLLELCDEMDKALAMHQGVVPR